MHSTRYLCVLAGLALISYQFFINIIPMLFFKYPIRRNFTLNFWSKREAIITRKRLFVTKSLLIAHPILYTNPNRHIQFPAWKRRKNFTWLIWIPVPNCRNILVVTRSEPYYCSLCSFVLCCWTRYNEHVNRFLCYCFERAACKADSQLNSARNLFRFRSERIGSGCIICASWLFLLHTNRCDVAQGSFLSGKW